MCKMRRDYYRIRCVEEEDERLREGGMKGVVVCVHVEAADILCLCEVWRTSESRVGTGRVGKQPEKWQGQTGAFWTEST